MATRMQQRRGTAAQWTAANPVLAAGEIGFETDTSKFKMGNGSSNWAALTYFANAEELAALIDGAPDLLNTLNELAAAMGDDPNFFVTVGNDLGAHLSSTTSIHGIGDTALLATKSYADAAIAAHKSITIDVHGIADTAVLVTASNLEDSVTGAVSAHQSDTTLIHGIADTALLATKSYADTADADFASQAADALNAHNLLTENIHGILDTSVLATLTDLSNSIASATVDQESLAGVGIDWNPINLAYDIDSTVATKSYADDAVGNHNSDTTNVHGIADTAALALTATVNSALDLKAPLESPTFTGTVSGVTKTMVGLENVDNTSDSSKPVSTATQTELDIKAPLASPALTGVPTAPTATAGTATTQVATTAFVGTAVSNLVASSPEALDTLNELANALGNDANFSTTLTNNLALKAPLASPALTGTATVVNLTASGTVTLPAAGIVFSDGTQAAEGVPSRTPIIQKTGSYTLSVLTERDNLLEMSSGSAMTLTIPTDATLNFPIGTSLDILQTSTGQVTFAGAAGVTVNATPGLKLRTTFSSATLFKRAANTWVVYGDLTA
jgi:hypothetical protein